MSRLFIESINLIGFGKFANRTLNFNSHFNFIIGANEAGKTTLIDAIMGVLYGFKGRGDDIRALKARYKPWDTALPYQASLTMVDNNNDRYCITRNFTDDKTDIQLWRDNSFMPAGQTVAQILTQSLGLNNRRLFASTLLIKQTEISTIDGSNLSAAVMQKITEGGTEVNIENIFSNLADTLKQYNRGIDRPATNPGLIKSITVEIEKAQIELQELEQHESAYFSLGKKLKEQTSLYHNVSQRLATIEPIINQGHEKTMLQDRKEQILLQQNKLQAKIDKINEKQQLLNKCFISLQSFAPVAQHLNDSNLRQLEQNWSKCRSIDESIINDLLKEQPRTNIFWGLGLIILSLTGLLMPKPFNYIWPTILVTIGLVWILWRNQLFPAQNGKTLVSGHLKKEIANLNSQKNKCQAFINNILSMSSSLDIDDFRKKMTRFNEAQKEQLMLSEAITNLCSGLQPEEIKNGLTALSVELLNINQQISAIDIDSNPQEIKQLTDERNSLADQKKILGHEIIILETQFDFYRQDLLQDKDIWSLRAAIREMENQLKIYQTQCQSIELAIQVMTAAVEEAQTQMAPQVNSEVSRIFATITDQRYKEVDMGIDNRNLFFRVLTPETGAYLEVDKLSTGTKDQFYLALRLALGQYLTGHNIFPLFLDDPLTNFDSQRLIKTLKILQELAANHQIIWLSKDDYGQTYLPNITANYL